MFDLNAIEYDWINNSFSLNEEDIIELFRSEGATLGKYNEEIENYKKNTHINISAERKLLLSLFDQKTLNKINKHEKKLRKKYPYPTKKHLSEESQKIVIEGCMYMVFNATKQWYSFFNEKISQERLYYVCLEALIKCVKYVIHCEEPVFELYVYKCIERNIIKNVAKWEHLSYRDVYVYVNNLGCEIDIYGNEIKQLNFKYDNKEITESPATIFYMMKNNKYDVDYIKDVSSEQFIKDYYEAIDELSDIEKVVMQLLYDRNGFKGLTFNEISDYLGLRKNDIVNAKKRALKKLRKNNKIKNYL